MKDIIWQLCEIAEKTPVIKRMWIFGSRIKGTETQNSDLDLAIEVEWIEGQMLGVCSDPYSLWMACLPQFENEMQAICPWKLDLQQYIDSNKTSVIHTYLEDASKQIYEKN